jgi:hypothetical protein
MKKIILILLLSFSVFITISSCTPDNPSTPGTPSPFTLKYEITTSVPVANSPISNMTYYNGTGQAEVDQTFTSGTVWTKEITVTTPNRPFVGYLSGAIFLTAPGTATGKIYVNGQAVASVTNPTSAGTNTVTIPMFYPIN